MAYGVKIQLQVDTTKGSPQKLRAEIQRAVNNASKSTPIVLKNFKATLSESSKKQIIDQLQNSLSSADLAVKIKEIDASQAIRGFRKQLETMLSGLSITGLREFLGTEGTAEAYNKAAAAANKLAEAQGNIRRRAQESTNALQALRSLNQSLQGTYRSTLGIKDSGAMQQYVAEYNALNDAIQRTKRLEGSARTEEIGRLTTAIALLKQKVAATLEGEKASARQAASAASAAKREETLASRVITMRKKITQYVNENPKAYEANRVAIDRLLGTLNSGAPVTATMLASIQKEFLGITEQANQSGIAGQTFFQKLQAGWAKFGGWSIVTRSMMAAYRLLNNMVSTVKELDAAMTELRKVTDLTDVQYSTFFNQAAQTAKRIGVTLSDTINSTADFARLGFDIDDASELAEAALIYKNVGDGIDDISFATESLISTIKAFGDESYTAMEIVDMFNEVGNNFAISSSGIGEALQRSAAALSAAGNTLEESIGLITGMNAILQNPEQVGTALKTITMYLRAARTEAAEAGIDTEGMASSVSVLRQKLIDLAGVDIMIDDSTFKSTFEIIKELSEVWDRLNDVTQSNVLNLIGGKRQANANAALIRNFSDAEAAMLSASHALGSASKENEKYMSSIAGRAAVLQASFQEMSASVIGSGLVKAIVEIATTLTHIVTTAAKLGVLLPSIVTSISSIKLLHGFLKGVSISNALTQLGAGLRGGTANAAEYSNMVTILKGSIAGLNPIQRQMTAAVLQNNVAFKSFDATAQQNILSLLGLNASTKTLSTGMHGLAASAKAAWASMSRLQMASLIFTGASIIISVLVAAHNAISAASEKAARKRQEELEAATRHAQEQSDNAIEAMSSYLELAESLEQNVITQEEFNSSSNKIILSLLQQGETVDGLIEKYGGLKEAVIAASIAELENASGGLWIDRNAARDNLLNAYHGHKMLDIYIASKSKSPEIADPIRAIFAEYGFTEREQISNLGLYYRVAVDLNPSDKSITGLQEHLDKLRAVSADIANTVGGGTESEAYIALELEIERISGLIDAYNNANSELQQNILGQIYAQYSGEHGIPKTQEAYDAMRESLAMLLAENIQFQEISGSTDEEIQKAAQSTIDLFILGQTWASRFSNEAAVVVSSSDSLGDSIKKTAEAYNILNKAIAEMGNGGLSLDTIQTIISMLGEDENINDYLYAEADAIRLNVEAWEERSNIISSQLAAKQKYLDDLNAEQDAAYSPDREKEIWALEQEIYLYELILQLSQQSGKTGEETTGGIFGSEEIERVAQACDMLERANKEMEDGGAISYDTAKGIQALLGEEENIYQYIQSQNGVLTLNTAAWKERAKAILEASIAEAWAKYDTLQAEFNELDAKDGTVDNYIPNDELEKAQAIVSEMNALAAEINALNAMGAGFFGDNNAPSDEVVDQWAALGDAIGDVKDVAQLLADMSMQDADPLAILRTLLDFAKDHTGFNIASAFTFDNDTDTFTWNPNAITEYINGFLDADEGIAELEAAFPGITQWLKDSAVAAEEGANAFESFDSAISNLSNVQDILERIQNNDSPWEIFRDLVKLANDYGADISTLFSFDSGELTFSTEGIEAIRDHYINALAELPGISEELATYLAGQMIDAEEAATSYEALGNAISKVKDASSLLTDIQSGEGDMLSMLQSVAEIAEEGGGSLLNYITVTDGAIRFSEQHIRQYAEDAVGALSEYADIPEELRTALIHMIEAEVEAANAAEWMKTAHDNAANAIAKTAEITHYAELTYDSLQELLEIDARYAYAVEYHNGILRLNEQGYIHVTDSIAEETIAMSKARIEAILLSTEYQDLNSRINSLSLQERQRLDALNVEIMGYAALTSELKNATSAYNNFVRASSDPDSTRYGAAKNAYKVIADTLYNADSDIYGKIGREQFRYAMAFLIDPEIEVNDAAFDQAFESVERYVTEDITGMQNFYDDLLENGLIKPTANGHSVNLDEVAATLGIPMELVRTLFDELNEYQEEPIRIHAEGSDSEVEDMFENIRRYTSEAHIELERFYDDLMSGGYIDAENNLLVSVDDLATRLGISSDLARLQLENLNAVLAEDKQIKFDADTTAVDESQSRVATLTAEIQEANTQIDALNGETVDIHTNPAVASVNKISSSLMTVLDRMNQIKNFGRININIGRSGGIFGLMGFSAAGGTKNAVGGRTLMGENGTEIVVDPSSGRWYTVGVQGAEFINLPMNAIVFNASQTKELLSSGHTSRGQVEGRAMSEGNASNSFGGLLISTAKSIAGSVGGVLNSILRTSSDIADGNFIRPSGKNTQTTTSNSSSKPKGPSLTDILETYEEINKQTEHLIRHQEHLYKVSERAMRYTDMESSLIEQLRLYRKIMEDSQRGVRELIAAGADDTHEELQGLEEAYWGAYDSVQDTLDQINKLYIGALNDKIDSIQDSYSDLAGAAEEFNAHGGITVDTFQSLVDNGVQYLSMLDQVNGKYVINEEGIRRMIAAEKEQLAIEAAMSYISQIRTALTDESAEALAHLVDLTNQIGDSSWSAVYAQAALLQNMGLSGDQYDQVIQNINALRDIAGNVIDDITADLAEGSKNASEILEEQADALDKILEYTKDLIRAEVEDRAEALEDEIDAYKKIIDLKKESLDLTREEDEYARDVQEKTREIADLQAKIDKLSLDNSREAQAERSALQEELRNAQDALASTQDDHAYNAQIDALEKMAEAFEEEKQREIEILENTISSEEKLYNAAIERIKTQWDSLYAQLIAWNTESGSVLNKEITENWELALEAVQKYGSYLEALDAVTNPANTEKPIVVAGALPQYHTGGVVDGRGAINDTEVLAVLEKGEVVLDGTKKQGLYRLVDFNRVLAERLGIPIANIGSAPLQHSGLLNGSSPIGGVSNQIGSVTFSPKVEVKIVHGGVFSDEDASAFGNKVATSTIDELYKAFRNRGVGSLFGAQLVPG